MVESPTPDSGAAAAISKVKLIAEESVLSMWINSKNNLLYYVAKDGKIMRTRGMGKAETASNQTLPGFHAIIPSRDGSKAIASFYYPQATIFSVFNAENASWERLPDGTVAADFSPSGEEIAYLRGGQDPSLNIVNLKTKKNRKVMALRYSGEGTLYWQTADAVNLISSPAADLPTEWWVINISQRTIARKEGVGSASMITLARENGLGLLFQKIGFYENKLNLIANGGVLAPLGFKPRLRPLPALCFIALYPKEYRHVDFQMTI